MNDISKTVFISYRRDVSYYVALAIAKALRDRGYDVFLDVDNIDSGEFGAVLLNQIAARSHFLLILAPGSLERCAEPDDWLRQEIEQAINLQRNIVPVMVNNFSFRGTEDLLTGTLVSLSKFNALEIPQGFFDEAIEKLCARFLKKTASATVESQNFGTPEQQYTRGGNDQAGSASIPASEPGRLSAFEPKASFLTNYHQTGWGSAISIVNCTEMQRGWLMSEVEVDHKSILFELQDDELTAYKAYFDAHYVEKRFHIDKPRMSVQAIPTILSDTPQLVLHTVETKFSVARFFGDVIAHDNLKRDFYLDRLFNDNIISFPHSLCLHAVIATSDNHILIVKRPPKIEFYPSAWQCSLSEQFDLTDVEQPLQVLQCGKRMLHEELGLDDDDGYDAENMRVLSVFLEGDLLNISLLSYIKLNLDRDELDHHLRYGLRPDLEFNHWKFAMQDDLETMLFSTDGDLGERHYHPVAKYAMYMTLIHNDKKAARRIADRLKPFKSE